MACKRSGAVASEFVAADAVLPDIALQPRRKWSLRRETGGIIKIKAQQHGIHHDQQDLVLCSTSRSDSASRKRP